MKLTEYLSWRGSDKHEYVVRFAVFIGLYWLAYISSLFFAVCLGRSTADDVLILGGSSVYVVCIAAVSLLFLPRSTVGFAAIAVLTSSGFRLLALLPHYAESSSQALTENLLMHVGLAFASCLIGFALTSFLFRREVA